mmetsp:Transcript_503/g.1173  ORF Transcript_503/g.1173 Transcript_503/m.1173 type:complete len:310 (+) Transcript_503:252-1181(+)
MVMKARSRSGSHGSNTSLHNLAEGPADSLDYRIKTVDKDSTSKVVSLWHDVSLVHIDPASNLPTPYLNFVCEIPKFSRKKYEIATDEEGNPIKQDSKKGVLREFKKGDIFFNYGCFPRTWEDPTFIHPDALGCRGDNDPLDVCDIGMRITQPGEVRPVKVLGILCMIDEGEADWKVVVIDAMDKWAPFLKDIKDVEKNLPGQLEAIREWFRTYKMADGKPPNIFGLDENFMNKKYAMEVIKECNGAWKDLITGKAEREMKKHGEDEGISQMVRKLSKSNLLSMVEDEVEPQVPAAHQDVGQDDDEPPSF